MVLGINVIGVLGAAVANMVWGFVWYGPLFGEPWAKLMGFDLKNKKQVQKMQQEAKPLYLYSFIAAILTALILSVFMDWMAITTVLGGASVGMLAWLGFVATTQFTQALFAKKPMTLLMIDTGYQMAALTTMGIILALTG